MVCLLALLCGVCCFLFVLYVFFCVILVSDVVVSCGLVFVLWGLVGVGCLLFKCFVNCDWLCEWCGVLLLVLRLCDGFVVVRVGWLGCVVLLECWDCFWWLFWYSFGFLLVCVVVWFVLCIVVMGGLAVVFGVMFRFGFGGLILRMRLFFVAGDCCVSCLILVSWCGVFVGTGFGLVGCGVLFIFDGW